MAALRDNYWFGFLFCLCIVCLVSVPAFSAEILLLGAHEVCGFQLNLMLGTKCGGGCEWATSGRVSLWVSEQRNKPGVRGKTDLFPTQNFDQTRFSTSVCIIEVQYIVTCFYLEVTYVSIKYISQIIPTVRAAASYRCKAPTMISYFYKY